jgi:hypothetical protein
LAQVSRVRFIGRHPVQGQPYMFSVKRQLTRAGPTQEASRRIAAA